LGAGEARSYWRGMLFWSTKVTGSTTVCSVFYDAGAIAPGDSLGLAPDDPLASGGLG
jgi:hypothetical protein